MITGSTISFWSFILFATLCGYISIRKSKQIASIKEFFHDGKINKNAISYTAANITLGTGVIYILVSISNLGALFLIAPIMLFLGYISLSEFYKRYVNDQLCNDDIISDISQEIDTEFVRKKYFGATFSLILIFSYILILCYEIFVSSHFLALMMFKTPTTIHEVFAGSSVFFVALLYTLWGGYKGVQTTDVAQFVFVIILLFVGSVSFYYTAPDTQSHTPERLLPSLSFEIIFAVISVGITAFATQYYSIMTICATTQQERSANKRKLLRKIGLFSFIILISIVIGSLVVSYFKGNPYDLLIRNMTDILYGTTIKDYVVSSVLMLGFASIIFSTVDTLLLSLGQMAYSNILNRNTNNSKCPMSELRTVRLGMIIIFPFIYSLLAIIWYTQPDKFNLLIAFTSGNNVLMPLLCLSIYLCYKGRLSAFKCGKYPPLFWCFFLLYFVSAICSFIFTIAETNYAIYISPANFLIGCAFAVIILRRKTCQ